MPGYNGSSRLVITPVWVDGELVEIETRLTTDDWRGFGRSYTTTSELMLFAEQICVFARNTSTPLTIQTSYPYTESTVELRFAEYNAAGHVSCQIALKTNLRYDTQKAQISVELKTEPTFVDQFGRELLQLAKHQEGAATLIFE